MNKQTLFHRNKKGFTLIELLVVMAILGILTALVATSVIGARRGARDARRLGDIRSIMTTLEQFYRENGRYPNSALAQDQWSCADEGHPTDWISENFFTTHFQKPIRDPKQGQGIRDYCYNFGSSGQTYALDYSLERATGNALGTECYGSSNPPRYCVRSQ